MGWDKKLSCVTLFMDLSKALLLYFLKQIWNSIGLVYWAVGYAMSYLSEKSQCVQAD